jgi:hypothetical protein
MPIINPFVKIRKSSPTKKWPREHIVLCPNTVSYQKRYDDEFSGDDFPYYGEGAFYIDDSYLPEPRAIRCVGNDVVEAIVSLPFLSQTMELPALSRSRYIFHKSKDDVFPLPVEAEKEVVIESEHGDMVRFSISYTQHAEVYGVYRYENGLCNQFDIYYREKKSDRENLLLHYEFNDKSTPYRPSRVWGKAKPGTITKKWDFIRDGNSSPNGVLVDPATLDMPGRGMITTLHLANSSSQTLIRGSHGEFYSFDNIRPFQSLREVQHFSYNQLADFFGSKIDEHRMLGDTLIFSDSTFIEKRKGFALGIETGTTDRLKMHRLGEADFIYTDGPISLLIGNILLQTD